ncbi:hypothetical protein Tco_1049428, partial [Tanacetum coccineum]
KKALRLVLYLWFVHGSMEEVGCLRCLVNLVLVVLTVLIKVSSTVLVEVRIGPLVFSTWMAFGGNTRDLGSFGKETDEITDLHQILKEILLTGRGDGVASIKRRRHDPSSDDVRDLVTVLRRGRVNEDLVSST